MENQQEQVSAIGRYFCERGNPNLPNSPRPPTPTRRASTPSTEAGGWPRIIPMTKMKITSLLLSCGLAMPAASAAISLSSIDTFTSSNAGWRIGSAGVQPTHNSGNSFNGQPGFLSHFSDGGGANGKWLMWSTEAQWIGNYAAAGVTGISFWANVTTGADINMRVAISGAGGVFATNAITLVAIDGWTRYAFDLTAANMSYIGGGTNDFASTLSNVNKLEIFGGAGSPVYKSPNGGFAEAGTSTNTIWIDHVTAIPEPIASGMAIGGFALMFGIRRKRR
jgi:hypothetical protein